MPKTEVHFTSNLQGVKKAIQAAMHARMEQACLHLVNATKRRLTGQRSGRIYTVPGTTWSRTQTVSRKTANDLTMPRVARLSKTKTGEYLFGFKQGGGFQVQATGAAAKQAYRSLRQAVGGRAGSKLKIRRRTYQASAPGEAPAVRFGRLRNSIRYRLEGQGFSLRGIVGTALDYSTALEKGTTKMAARPFLKPTFEHERIAIKEILGGKWIP